MKKLIEALEIFLKYKDSVYPTHCEHDVFSVVDITEDEVSDKDKAKLDKLGFFWNDEYGTWSSFRYGSA